MVDPDAVVVTPVPPAIVIVFDEAVAVPLSASNISAAEPVIVTVLPEAAVLTSPAPKKFTIPPAGIAVPTSASNVVAEVFAPIETQVETLSSTLTRINTSSVS